MLIVGDKNYSFLRVWNIPRLFVKSALNFHWYLSSWLAIMINEVPLRERRLVGMAPDFHSGIGRVRIPSFAL